MKSLIAVVVSYQPDFDELSNLLAAIGAQVALTVVVDNGSSVDVNGFLADRNDPGVHCLLLDNNKGVAMLNTLGFP